MQIIDRKYRQARIWSNYELKKMASLFTGDVCNVSAWRDQDKQGSTYREYFSGADSYSMTNYHDSEARGFQKDIEGQILLDLESQLEPSLERKFDVVFNHTTLEHVFDCLLAIKNMCLMSKDAIILVVPFLQETHADYGDFWRYTPQGLDKILKQNGFETVYFSCNDQSRDSIYLYFMAARDKDKWSNIAELPGNQASKVYTEFFGTKIIKNSLLDNIYNLIATMWKK